MCTTFAMIGTNDQSRWLSKAGKVLLLTNPNAGSPAACEMEASSEGDIVCS